MGPLQWREQKLIYLALVDRMAGRPAATVTVLTPVPKQRREPADSVRSPGVR